MKRKSNVIYVGVNPNLIWTKSINSFLIRDKELLEKNIKPWKSKCGTKLMYQLYNPETKIRIVYTRLMEQEPFAENGETYYKFLPETAIETALNTELRIINTNQK